MAHHISASRRSQPIAVLFGDRRPSQAVADTREDGHRASEKGTGEQEPENRDRGTAKVANLLMAGKENPHNVYILVADVVQTHYMESCSITLPC